MRDNPLLYIILCPTCQDLQTNNVTPLYILLGSITYATSCVEARIASFEVGAQLVGIQPQNHMHVAFKQKHKTTNSVPSSLEDSSLKIGGNWSWLGHFFGPQFDSLPIQNLTELHLPKTLSNSLGIVDVQPCLDWVMYRFFFFFLKQENPSFYKKLTSKDWAMYSCDVLSNPIFNFRTFTTLLSKLRYPKSRSKSVSR